MADEEQLKRIADTLEKITSFYEHPEEYIARLAQGTAQALGQVSVDQTLPSGPISVEVKLSEEERKAICDRAMADIEEQMTEFKGFISQALSELPPGTLKRIGELMKKGEKFKLRRRHGCVYLDFGQGDDDFYLRI